MSTSRKPSFLFYFPRHEQASEFFSYAQKQGYSTNVQHPFNNCGKSKPLYNRVLVTGTGSFLFDSLLQNTLADKATELGGFQMPKI